MLGLEESAPRKMFFAHCVAMVRFKADDGRFRRLVLRALAEGWARPRELGGVCISLIRLNGAVVACSRARHRGVADRLNGQNCSALRTRRNYPGNLLRCFIECDPVIDIGLERLLTNMRRSF